MFRIPRFVAIFVPVGLLCLSFAPLSPAQSWKTSIGFNYLIEQIGNVEDGTGLQLIQVEAPNGQNNYMPVPGNAPEFTGKTLIDATGTNGGNITGVSMLGVDGAL